MGTAERDEARALLDAAIAEIERLSWDDLDQYEERSSQVSTGSGREFVVRTMAYWDMDAWESDMWIVARARLCQGESVRRWPYTARTIRGGEQLPH